MFLIMISLSEIIFNRNKVIISIWIIKNSIHFTVINITSAGDYACSINDAHCFQINNYCLCHCLPGYILADKKCSKSKIALYLITIRWNIARRLACRIKKRCWKPQENKHISVWRLEMLKYIIQCSRECSRNQYLITYVNRVFRQ